MSNLARPKRITSENKLTAFDIDPLLNVREVAGILGISIPSVWRRVSDGTLPRPLKLGGLSRWQLSDVETAIDAAIAKRGA